jgi:hypothetical protein
MEGYRVVQLGDQPIHGIVAQPEGGTTALYAPDRKVPAPPARGDAHAWPQPMSADAKAGDVSPRHEDGSRWISHEQAVSADDCRAPCDSKATDKDDHAETGCDRASSRRTVLPGIAADGHREERDRTNQPDEEKPNRLTPSP